MLVNLICPKVLKVFLLGEASLAESYLGGVFWFDFGMFYSYTMCLVGVKSLTNHSTRPF